MGNPEFNDGGWMIKKDYHQVCEKCGIRKRYTEYDTYVIDSGGYDWPWRTTKKICKKCNNK